MTALSGLVRAEAIRVVVPFRSPIRNSVGLWTRRDSWILRLYTASGLVGLGEAALDYGAAEAAAELARLVAGTVETMRAGADLPTAAELEGHGEAGLALRCAIDSALLDLRRESPVAATRQARAVPLNATLGYRATEALVLEAMSAVAAGFGTLKLKAGPERNTAELVERVAAVRRAVGPDVRLRLDVNGAWSSAVASKRLAALAPFRLEFVEQPVPADDPAGLAAVHRTSPVPIAADESVSSPAVARALISADAADVLVVKPSRVGGPVAVWEIATVAAEMDVPVVVSTLFETGVGLAAALAAAAGLPTTLGRRRAPAHGLATAELLESDLLTHRLEVSNGAMMVPEGPGLGITVDELALRRYAVEWIGERP